MVSLSDNNSESCLLYESEFVLNVERMYLRNVSRMLSEVVSGLNIVTAIWTIVKPVVLILS